MSVEHYENFPVASVLLPPPLRLPVATIYRFARSADDLADEGSALPAQRLSALAAYHSELRRIGRGAAPETPLFVALKAVIEHHDLDIRLFHDLLSAFEQDVSVTRYDSYESLLDYCRRSANPVGRLMLALYRAETPEYQRMSDQICTALQLINFWQDVAIDYAKDRIYLPLEDLRKFDVAEQTIAASTCDTNFRALLAFEVERTRALMCSGAPLALALPGRIGLELRLVIQGGLRILEKIERVQYNVFQHRPVLRPIDWPRMALRAITMRA